MIVDDVSTDHTPDVTARLAGDARVKVLRNETSVGPGGARNQGVAAATRATSSGSATTTTPGCPMRPLALVQAARRAAWSSAS